MIRGFELCLVSVTINLIDGSKLRYPEGKERIDMCAAIEEMKMDSKLEGKLEGKIEGKIEGTIEAYREVGISLQETIQRIAKKFNISLQQSEEETKKYW